MERVSIYERNPDLDERIAELQRTREELQTVSVTLTADGSLGKFGRSKILPKSASGAATASDQFTATS